MNRNLIDETGYQLAKRRYEMIKSLGTPETVLEIGCGYGHFLSRFPSEVYTVGIEPDKNKFDYAKKNFDVKKNKDFGIHWLINKEWEDLIGEKSCLFGREFDLICLWHSLEHMKYPYSCLDFCHEHLSLYGYLIISVPDISNVEPDLVELGMRISKEHRYFWSAPYFCDQMFMRGFSPIKIIKEEFDPALRSSFTIIFQTRETCWIKENEAKVEYHLNEKKMINKIRNTWKEWQSQGRRIAIYGAGQHTKTLLEVVLKDLPKPVAILDDDLDGVGSHFCGINVYSPKAFHVSHPNGPKLNVDVILVSSGAFEDRMITKIVNQITSKKRRLKDIQVFGIYKDILKRR